MSFLVFTFITFLLIFYRFNVYQHNVALALPWLLIVSFQYFPISELHVYLSFPTLLAIFLFLIFYFFGTRFSNLKIAKSSFSIEEVKSLSVRNRYFYAFVMVFLCLTTLNVLLAGYIPLIRALLTGDSGYMDFGISGLYGIYNAFANSLGLLSFYLFLKTGNRKYLVILFVIFFVFIFFMTRQNILSLLVEVFVVYGFIRGFTSKFKILMLLTAILLVFSILGNIRTQEIGSILEVTDSFLGYPTLLYWLYSYFYLSAMNFDNAILLTSAPYYDGSSFLSLVPNVVKSLIGVETFHEYFLQKINFTVSSALQPLYSDFGFLEILFFAFIIGFLTQKQYKKAVMQKSFKAVSGYSVLFFCCLFSFFVNFWFYLPIIFQLVFFYIYSRTVVIERG